MKAFLYAMRYRLICTAISLAFLAWHSHTTAAPLACAEVNEAAYAL